MPLVLSGSNGISANGTAAIQVDTSGRMILPNQPAFRAYGPVAADASYVTFESRDAAFSGRDGGMNIGTGTFTAPTAGMYLFTFNFLHGSGGAMDYARVLFVINGGSRTSYGDNLVSFVNQYHSTQLCQVFRLAANDTVRLFNEGRRIYGPSYGSFSGVMLG